MADKRLQTSTGSHSESEGSDEEPLPDDTSLEVLPRIVDPGQHLSTARVTRVALYGHFFQQWLERGKKRIGEKDLTPQARAAFERLSAEGFALNGIEYLKRLAVAVHKEQGGHPVVEYSQLKDEGYGRMPSSVKRTSNFCLRHLL